MKTTPGQGLPFAVPTDLAALPAQAKALLDTQDGKLPGWDLSFLQAQKTAGFMTRVTVAGFNQLSGSLGYCSFDTVDYNVGLGGTGATSSVSGTTWSQPKGDGNSWWILGAIVYSSYVAGTVTVGSLMQAHILITDTDPNSPSGAQIHLYDQGACDSIATSGPDDPMSIVTLVRCRGNASAVVAHYFRDTGAGMTRRVGVGSAFFGFRVGSA